MGGRWLARGVDFPILLWLVLGSIRGALTGGWLSILIPERRLRFVLAGVLGLVGIELLDVPGASVIAVVALSAGGVALLVWLARHSWVRIQRARDGGVSAVDPAG